MIEQQHITIIPALQKLDNRTPDKFMTILWYQDSHYIHIKKMTIGYIKDSEYIEKPKTDKEKNIRDVSKIYQDKLPPMPEKSTFTFHHNFYPKPKLD